VTTVREALRTYHARGTTGTPAIEALRGLQRFLISAEQFTEADSVADRIG
jgi:hypothetical protein